MNPLTDFLTATNPYGKEPADARWASYYDGEYLTDLPYSSPETQLFKDNVRVPVTPLQEVVPESAWASSEDWQEMMRIKEKGALPSEHWPIDADYTYPDEQEDSLLQQKNIREAADQLFTEIVGSFPDAAKTVVHDAIVHEGTSPLVSEDDGVWEKVVSETSYGDDEVLPVLVERKTFRMPENDGGLTGGEAAGIETLDEDLPALAELRRIRALKNALASSAAQSPSSVQGKQMQLGAVEDIIQALNAYHIEGTGVPEKMGFDPISPVLELVSGVAPTPAPTVTRGTATTDPVLWFPRSPCLRHHRVMNHDLGANQPVKVNARENASNVDPFINSFEASLLETITSPEQCQPAVIMTRVAGTAEHLKLVAKELSEVEATSLGTQQNIADSPKRGSRAGNRQDYREALAVKKPQFDRSSSPSDGESFDRPKPGSNEIRAFETTPPMLRHEGRAGSVYDHMREAAAAEQPRPESDRDTSNRSRAPTLTPPAAIITRPYETSDSEIEAVDLIPTTLWSPHHHNSPSHSESAKQHSSLLDASSHETPLPPANSARLARGSGRTQTSRTSASTSASTRFQIQRESRTEEEYFEVLSRQAAAEAMEDMARGVTPRETRSRRGFGGSPVPGNPPLAAARGVLGKHNTGVDRRGRRNSGR